MSASTAGLRFIPLGVVHFGLDVWVFKNVSRGRQRGSGSCCLAVFWMTLSMLKTATVNRLWIWMTIFKIIFTNVLLFKHVRANVSASVCRGKVDCILYGMFNVTKKKKKKEIAGIPFIPSCCLLSRTTSSVRLQVKAPFTELRLTFFAILKEEIQSCDHLRNTLLRIRGVSPSTLSLLSSHNLDLFFLWNQNIKTQACRQQFNFAMSVWKNLICPCIMLVSLYYVMMNTGWDAWATKSWVWSFSCTNSLKRQKWSNQELRVRNIVEIKMASSLL